MAHHKSALKRIRQNRKLRIYNRMNKKMLRTAIKEVMSEKNFAEASEKLNNAYKILDRIAAHRILHRNNVANKKSRLAKYVNSLHSKED